MKQFLLTILLAIGMVNVVSASCSKDLINDELVNAMQLKDAIAFFEEKVKKQLLDEHLVTVSSFFTIEEETIFEAQTKKAGCHTMVGCWVSKIDNAFGVKLYTIEINHKIVPVLCIEKKLKKKSKNRVTNPKANFFVLREIYRYVMQGTKPELTPSENRAIDIAAIKALYCKTCIKKALNSWWVTGWDIFGDVVSALANDYNTYHTVKTNKKLNRMNHNALIPQGCIWDNQKFVEGYIKDQTLPKKCDVCCPKKEKKIKVEKVKSAKKIKKS